MKRKLRQRILSGVLSVIMTLSSIPAPILANEETTNPNTECSEFYLFIENQQEGIGTITDLNEEKEYFDVFEKPETELLDGEELGMFYKASLYEAEEEVKLHIEPKDGYELVEVFAKKIETVEGEDLFIDSTYDEESDILSFVMPKANVCVSASFKAKKTVDIKKCEDGEHVYEDNVIMPTCVNNGYTIHICSICGDIYNDTETQAIGHNYSSVIAVEATCTENGVENFTCDNCGHSYINTIEKIGHNYKEEVTEEASNTKEGLKTFTCSVCGDVYTEAIPIIESKLSDEKKSGVTGETVVSDIYIRELTTQLFYGAVSDGDGGYVWNANKSDKGHRFSFRINYAISGVDTAPVNSVKLTIPKSILVDRDGGSGDIYEMSIPSKSEIDAFLDGVGESIDMDVNWGYFEEGDNIILYNFRELEAGNNGFIELSYLTDKTTYNYIDMLEQNPFTCLMTVPNDSKEANPITVKINTKAEVDSTNKHYPVKYNTWQSSWGNQAKPLNDTEYQYLVWTIETHIDATQPYNFTLLDNVVGNFDGMEVIAYKFSGQTEFTSTNTILNQTQNSVRYDYVITSIPLKNYKNETYWEANNTIIATVDPVDQIDEDTQASGERRWTWTKPVFSKPTGYVNVYKSADSDYRRGNVFGGNSHRASSLDFSVSEYTRYDMETFNGYNENKITNAKLDGFKYASWIVGYAYPWTYDPTFNDQRNPDAYGKLPVKYELIDEGICLTNETENVDEYSDMLNNEDFKFTSLGYSWYMTDAVLDEDTQTFKEIGVNYMDSDILTFLGKFDDSTEWVQFATYNIKTNNSNFNSNYVQAMTNSNIVFNDNVNLVAYKVVTENSHYYTEIFTVPRLMLKNSETVMNYVTGKPAIGIINNNYANFYCLNKKQNAPPEMDTVITNVSTGDATVNIINQDSEGNVVSGAILQIADANNPDVIYAEWTSSEDSHSVKLDANMSYILREVFTPVGYVVAEDIVFTAIDQNTIIMTNDISSDVYEYVVFAQMTDKATEHARISQRYSDLKKSVVSVSNNVKKKTYTISWKVKQSEEMEWGAGGERDYIPQNGGIFYDLLPKGAILDENSMSVRAGEEFLASSSYTLSAIENFKDTGRTMVIININVPADYYHIYYDTLHSWNSLADYGKIAYNPVAYETGNESITNGFPDNGGQYYEDGTKNSAAINDAAIMSGLTTDLADDDTVKKFIYAEQTWNITALTSASSGLMKKVKAEHDNSYTYETNTTINGNYSYQLRYMNSYTSASKNIILFDSLENYDYDTMRNYGTLSDWRGTLQSIDLNQLKSKGIEPVVYYSTISKLDIEKHYDITDASVWAVLTDETDLSVVKAIAVDMSTTKAGIDFVLNPSDSLVVTLNMKAPSVCPEKEGDYAYAYNNVYVSNTVFNPEEESLVQDFLIHQDYTSVKLIITGDFGLTKVSSESEEIKIEGLEFRLMGTSTYGTFVDKIVSTDKNGQIYFKNIEMGSYILQEYKTNDDWLLDTTEHYVKIDSMGKVWIDGVEYTNSYITIKNKQRIHGDFDFYKKELGNSNMGILGAKFRLSGTSDYGNDILMYATSMSNGKVSFANIELGTYELEEVAANPNYFLNNIVYTLSVDNTGQVSIIASNEKDADGNVVSIEDSIWIELTNNGKFNIYNDYKYSEVLIRKVDATNPSIFLEGAIFSLTGVSNSGVKVDMTASSDKNGLVAFNGVEQGVYILKEIQAPKNLDETGKSGGNLNYMLDETKYVVKIQDKGVVVIEGLTQEENTGYFIISNDRAYDKEIVITKIWDDGLTTEERIAQGLIPKLHLTNRDLSQDPSFHTHIWDEGVILSSSTCTRNGETLYTCTDCGMTSIEKEATLEHAWDDGIVTPATCKAEGYTLYTCADCGTTKSETIEALPHSWDEGVISIEPSCTEEGAMLHACTACNTTKTEPIAMLPHDYSAEDGSCIVCGKHPYLYSSVVMHDAGTVTVTVSTSDYDYYNGSQKPNYSKIITFVPAESGTYTFKSTTSVDTYGCLYDANMGILASNDDGAGNRQFSITYTCTAGTVYYLAVGGYSNFSSATSIPIAIIKS